MLFTLPIKKIHLIGLIWFCLTLSLQAKAQQATTMQKDKIIYVFDPMCGWCFGFGLVMNDFIVQHKTAFDFDIISGGMVVGEREGEIGDFADYILGAYTRVEEYSGVKFGEPYLTQLKTKKLWSSSVKPAIAIETFKTFDSLNAIAFAHKVQEAYFVNGLDLRNEEVYKNLVKPFNINPVEFITKLQTEEMRLAANSGFQTAANWGITGYPAVLLVHNQKYYLVAKGYTNLETLNKTIEGVINSQPQK